MKPNSTYWTCKRSFQTDGELALLPSAGRLSLCRPYKLMPQPLCGLRAALLFLHLSVFPRRLPPSPPPGLARARGVAVREGGSTGGRGGEINTTRATRERTERQIDLIISPKEKIQIKTTPSAPSRTRLHPADWCASLPRTDRCFRLAEDLRFVIFTSTHYCLVFRKPHDIRRHDTS